MKRQNAKFQPDIIWLVKYNPCRSMSSRQKLHFCLIVFYENYKNSLSNLTENLKFTKVRVLNQNLMVKRYEYKWGDYAILTF